MRAPTAAPLSNRRITIAPYPSSAAVISGVRPAWRAGESEARRGERRRSGLQQTRTSESASTDAPAAMSSSTTGLWPWWTARTSGVWPNCGQRVVSSRNVGAEPRRRPRLVRRLQRRAALHQQLRHRQVRRLPHGGVEGRVSVLTARGAGSRPRARDGKGARRAPRSGSRGTRRRRGRRARRRAAPLWPRGTAPRPRCAAPPPSRATRAPPRTRAARPRTTAGQGRAGGAA